MKTTPLPVWIIRFIFFAISAWMGAYWIKYSQSRIGTLVFLGGALILAFVGFCSFIKCKLSLWLISAMIIILPSTWFLAMDILIFHRSNSIIDMLFEICLGLIVPFMISYGMLSNFEIREYYHFKKISE